MKELENKNFLAPQGFLFSINKTPEVNYFVQAVNIPQIVLGIAQVPTPFTTLQFPGDHVQHGAFSIVFRIDENMLNYFKLWEWIHSLGFPDDYEQAKKVWANSSFEQLTRNLQGTGIFSDAVLLKLNSAKNPVMKVTYKDLFPIGLGEITFDERNPSVQYVDGIATFAYRTFDVESMIR